MSRRFLINASWCALLCCAATGCYPHHQYPYGGTYPGPYGAPGPYQMPPGTVIPESTIPPGNYPMQPDLGQPVPPPQGALPSNGSQAWNDSFPNNTNTNYDGVDTQWKQPLNSPSGSDMNAPFDANSTASGRNTNPSGGFNSGSSSSQPVPSYQDPNQIRPNNNPPIDNTFPQNSSQPPQNDPFPADTNDQFQSNKNPQPQGGNIQMDDQFGPNNNDQFPGNTPQKFPEANDQFQENSDSGFSVPSPVQQQSFESSNDTFEANPKKFSANQGAPADTFEENAFDSSQEFQPPVQSFPENDNTFPENQNNPFPGNQNNPFPGNDDTFGPNSSSIMKSAPGQVSHANHQMPASGPQLVRSEQFMAPTKFQPASFEFPSGGGAATSAGKAPSPFSYDRQGYRWLRGVVEFDEQEKSWNITYNATPDQTDKFGGNIVLLDQGKLNRFKNGDVVLIDGRIDGSQQDRMGKPCYQVIKAQRLVPKK